MVVYKGADVSELPVKVIRVPNSHPVSSVSLKHLRNTCVASDWQAVTCLQALHTHLFYSGIQAVVLLWDQNLNVNCDYVEV
jgi:hypothetical protein